LRVDIRPAVRYRLDQSLANTALQPTGGDARQRNGKKKRAARG
jgi:hypothetical protein